MPVYSINPTDREGYKIMAPSTFFFVVSSQLHMVAIQVLELIFVKLQLSSVFNLCLSIKGLSDCQQQRRTYASYF